MMFLLVFVFVTTSYWQAHPIAALTTIVGTTGTAPASSQRWTTSRRGSLILLQSGGCRHHDVSTCAASFTPKSRTDSTSLLATMATKNQDDDNSGLQRVLPRSYYQVTIQYCTGCRWNLRSFWLAQELLTTFENDAALDAVTLVPSRPPEPGGIFRVQCYSSDPTKKDHSGTSNDSTLLWDRKENGGFPEAKELKQLVRDQIDPSLYLGHSDKQDRQTIDEAGHRETMADNSTNEREENLTTDVALLGARSPNVAITYCTGCRWLLRAAYMGQELLSTFDTEINSLSLIPSRPPAKGGQFTITLDGTEVIWDRAKMNGFPEIAQLKQRIRDKLVPLKDLGHSDSSKSNNDPKGDEQNELDDDEAERLRKWFGVA